MCEISVIIPAYNVEQYLDECFESLINQTHKDFEVIVVNDGSTDSTQYILERYCGIMNNLVVINQENSGSAGGPRNKGINIAKGKYIFFLDPDDKLPCTALEDLYIAITKSNADMVCGNYSKFKKASMWTLRHVTEKIYHSERLTTFNKEVEFTNNIIAWNKLYSKKFLIENSIYFDENLRYGEDRTFVMKSYVCAKSIHVIPNCVYNYRERENNNNKSATQELTIKTFNESIEACKMDVEVLKMNECKYTTRDIYNKDRSQHDFFRFIDYYASKNIDTETWTEIIRLAKEYRKLLDENMDSLSYYQRRKISFLLDENIEALKEYSKNKKKLYKCLYNEGRYKIKDFTGIKCLSQSQIDDVKVADLNLFHKIENLKIVDRILNINGWAYFHRFNQNTEKCMSKFLVFKANEKEMAFELTSLKRRDIALKKGKILFNYLYSGFEGQVNLKELKDLVNEEQQSVKIYLRLSINEKIYKDVYVNKLDVFRYLNQINNHNSISQRVENIEFTETYIKLEGWAMIDYESYSNYTDVSKKLIFVNRLTKEEHIYELINKKNNWCNSDFQSNPYKHYYAYPGWSINIPIYDINAGIYDAYIEVCNNNIRLREELKYPSDKLMKKRRYLDKGYINFNRKYKCEFTTNEHIREQCKFIFIIQDLKDPSYEINGGYIPIIGEKSDYWDYKDSDEEVMIKRIAVTYTNLQFWGTFLYTGLNKKILILEDEQGEKYSLPCSSYAFLYLNKKNTGWQSSVNYNIKDGRYKLKLEIQSDNRLKTADKFKLSNGLNNNKQVWNKEHFIDRTKVKFIRTEDLAKPGLYGIEVLISNSMDNKIEGIKTKVIKRVNQKLDKVVKKNKLIRKIKNKGFKYRTSIYVELYKFLSKLPVDYNKITLVSYKEKMPADYFEFYNRIKSEYPNVDIEFIGGNQKNLSQYIKMAFRFAKSGTILIDSYYRHLYNVKHRKETKFIQVWHATGIFKRFGLLAVGKNQANTKEFEINAHHYYTHVIVSGDEIVKPYAEAFGLPEERVLPLGVSRTDELFNIIEHEKVREKVYEIYPMFKGKKVILYAPTFRGDDDERKVFRNQLEFSKFEELSKQGYIIICKMHPAVQQPLVIPQNMKTFVYDVTKYPNINELFYVSDLLITDYSSSIFEFALLKKPMIFFAYDLDKYLNERGFYYDYSEFVPGPICRKTDEIVDCIKRLNDHDFEYDGFVEKYMNKCDGHATERLIELVKNR
ncbi:CDP-glycerol:poly(glycerophosphate) glycerophosphotransferase [Clostridium sp. DL-VIII]|uniref:bifunctional glycosyltransferase/CDP-glycerol:glycerophosphate glycerophosphotransferase n=1 Tax=Clostridium sp. DL-VIII TaxID=641107 RepID=UPI00023B0783|nr:CDP-glycerol glycerophosphotransferase family protein [Clostridium sp. DL-VIII]EHJ02135.1 CDP-glycerol:poly(glycerophosphate) glycerophosphotransferase [Clostridium sp. DL-VIII]